MITELLERFHLRWSGRTARAAARVDRAFAEVTATNGEVRKAAYDHADSDDFVRTTIDAVLDKMDRRELGPDDKTPTDR